MILEHGSPTLGILRAATLLKRLKISVKNPTC